ncbi:hypothetical protein NMY22_g9585 [Coprinellus aureogranulatus]|nr:hypothetical protein NMY22_g9585 [Coprinellus aureogranulatus]
MVACPSEYRHSERQASAKVKLNATRSTNVTIYGFSKVEPSSLQIPVALRVWQQTASLKSSSGPWYKYGERAKALGTYHNPLRANAEDTFLLLDALEADLETLKGAEPRICLEIGCAMVPKSSACSAETGRSSGSGCVSTFLAQILGPSSALYICTDINPHANRATRATGRQNGAELDVVNTAFALPLQERLHGKVDVVLFNPPYVPTSFEEAQMSQVQGDIGGAWAGGWDGMEVTNKFLEQVNGLLSETGRFYLVALKQNDVPEICARMLDRYQLQSEIVIERRAGREYLYIIRFTR